MYKIFFLRILNKQFGSQTVNMLFKVTGSVFVANYVSHAMIVWCH